VVSQAGPFAAADDFDAASYPAESFGNAINDAIHNFMQAAGESRAERIADLKKQNLIQSSTIAQQADAILLRADELIQVRLETNEALDDARRAREEFTRVTGKRTCSPRP